MPRVKFLGEKQGDFLNRIKIIHNLRWSDIVKDCKINSRTFFDWRRNKYQMNYSVFQLLCSKYGISALGEIVILSDNWNVSDAGRLGAIKRNGLYGNFGTLKGRQRGGVNSLLKFRENPEFARKAGFNLNKRIILPRKSSLLAEFIGIVLGDGSISGYQVRIYGNSKTDKRYSLFIRKIVKDLFGLDCTIALRRKNTIEIIISSKNLVDFLADNGLNKGHKIKNSINVPEWIFIKSDFIKGCLRGLMDTDGGIYSHNHVTKGIRYKNMGLCFTSHSNNILNSVHKMFLSLNINARNNKKDHVSVYAREEIKKYMRIVGSHNSKHIKRFNLFCKDTKI